MREIVIPYCPGEHQREVHGRLKRFNVLVCHRRFGKTVLAVNELIKGAVTCQRKQPRFAYIAPLYKQAKAVAWDYLQYFTKPIPGVTYNIAELRADFPNGARIQLFGADNPDALRGIYLDGVVLDEVAQMPPKAWSEVIRPALSDRHGWALFIGTPKGHNLFYDMYKHAQNTQGWYADVYPVSRTGILPQAELDDARAAGMSEDEYNQEFECSFSAAIAGAYYGKEMAQADADGRITSVAYDPAVPVDTYWDLGVSDSTVIWYVQQTGREVRIIDVLEGSGVGLDYYIREMMRRPYVYGRHVAPHDIEVRELSTGKSRKEIAAALGVRFDIAPQLPVQDGINAARALLARCWFDAVKCERGIEALKQYRREWNEKYGCFRANPLHDWTSHYADAFRYLAVSIKDRQSKGIDYKELSRRAARR